MDQEEIEDPYGDHTERNLIPERKQEAQDGTLGENLVSDESGNNSSI